MSEDNKTWEFIPIAVRLIDSIDEQQVITKLGKIAGVAYQSDKTTYAQRLNKCMRWS